MAAAGYFMPLSAETQLPEDLGTRHRAAIGLTEDVDAVVLVVSEERGEISVAIDGTLERNISSTDLAAQLHGWLGSEEVGRWDQLRAWWSEGTKR